MNPQLVGALMAAGAMPYVFTGIAKAGVFGGADNHRTRDWQAELEGWRKRAHWAQLNSFEVFPLFAVATLCAGLMAPQSVLMVPCAWGFVGARVLFGVCYLKNWASLRTLTFFIGMGAVVALFVEALRA